MYPAVKHRLLIAVALIIVSFVIVTVAIRNAVHKYIIDKEADVSIKERITLYLFLVAYAYLAIRFTKAILITSLVNL